MISLRPGKVTKRSIEDADTETLANVLNWNPGYEDARKFWIKTMDKNFWSLLKPEVVAKWGKPNAQMNSYESAPGVWILDDSQAHITWYIWTDLHHKNAWKGTSYELVISAKLTDKEMTEALGRLIEFMKIS
jgi:hypothetical protein